MIRLQKINVQFKSSGKTLSAVKNASLHIEKGDIFGVIGFSGAGKSTLLRCVNLLQRPNSGSVYLNSENITKYSNEKLRKKRQEIGMIFQNFNLFATRNAYQNVEFALMNSKMKKIKKKERILELLELVGLSDKLKSFPSDLSGGQKQRLAIARAIATNPSILLCDEATSALDPETTRSILLLLKKLNQKLGLTIMLISHEMEIVKSICNKMAIMQNGEIVETGSVYDVFSSPKTEIAKSFVHSSIHIEDALSSVKLSNIKGRILVLNYTGDSAKDPIIIELFKKFNLVSNILYGNMEVLEGKVFGTLMVEITGKSDDIKSAISYLISKKVAVKDAGEMKGGTCG